ncbi:MAG: hypothetical protein QXL10_01575 [Candidatus Bathyarchaeia archaeon]
MAEPKLCSNCPYISFIPIIKSEQLSYTRQREELSPLRLCQKLRAFAQRHNWKFQTCPYFTDSKRIDLYATAEAPR